jgi:isopenicillin N synthase-like dioxygenase
MATLRFLHYPASKAAAASTSAGEHTDYGNLTLLATDDVGGLEVRTRDGHWIEAPVVPGAFIVNIGDCLMRWTNDVYVSTLLIRLLDKAIKLCHCRNHGHSRLPDFAS